jgi:cobalt/nickel transport system permease protein
MMIRYLFVFGYTYRKVNESLATRCFNAFDTSLSWKYRMQQLGYAIGSMFIRAYEQGERVYTSMLCRGYGRNSFLFVVKKPLKRGELVFLSLSLVFVIVVPLSVWWTAFRMF